ncbi:MAG: amidase [Alphaproteobacteria bacterium]|nr:amidase [Alphaproteobacteria bacterium]
MTDRPIHALTATDAALKIARGELTSEQLVRACLERVTLRETHVRAFAHIDFDKAIEQARHYDRGPHRGLLHGVPVAFKDIVDSADFPSTYNSPIWAGNQPRSDAACIGMSKAAGGVVVGKTVTTEFANITPGPTRNPHDLSRTPGGSSQGSAAAVADGMVPLAIGTQTTGSTIRPAAYCGIVGYKPTFGDFVRGGMKVASDSLDTISILARSVDDCALWRAALIGTTLPDLRWPKDRKPRIAVCRTKVWNEADAATQRMIEECAERLVKAGASVGEAPLPREFDGLWDAHRDISSFEAARNFTWERTTHRDQLSPAFRDGRISQGESCPYDRYRSALELAARCRWEIGAIWDRFDLLLTPAAPGEAPVGITATGSAVFNGIWTLLYTPCITIPGWSGPAGMPIGPQLVAPRGEDIRLLALARWVQERLDLSRNAPIARIVEASTSADS